MPDPQTPALRVHELTKTYGDFTAVDRLSLKCAPGEILGIVGPNGAGKTTTMRCITGILACTSGSVSVAGADLATAPLDARRATAFIPDTPNPFDLLTVTEHLYFTALAYDLPEASERFAPLLAEFELTEKKDELASSLSRGMRQKLAIACAFLRDPRLILFDEPLTGLDPKAIRMMRSSIRLRADAGSAIIISSHLLDLVERLCDRVLVLHRGRTLALGTMDEIRAAASSSSAGSLEEAFFAITEAEGEGS